MLRYIAEKYCNYLSLHRSLLLWLCVFSFLSLIDIPSSPAFCLSPFQQYAYLTTVSIFKGTLLCSLMYPLFKKRLDIIVWLITGIYCVMALTNALSFIFYDMGISRKLILILAQTTEVETRGFLPGLAGNIGMLFKSGIFYLAVAVVLGLYFVVKKCNGKILAISVSALSLTGFVCFLSFSLNYKSGRSAHSLLMRVAKYGKEVYYWNRQFQTAASCRRALPDANTVSSSHLSHTVVVVIGESAIRSHHSLYGYRLQTTPNLEILADSLYIFTDVIGSSKSTAGNMERILSFKKDDTTFGDGLEFPLLIDYFKEAGYKTFWLSNQERMGTVSNTSGAMSMNSDVINYVGADNSEDALILKYDGALLSPFNDALTDSAEYKLIFVHLLGSHTEYRHRYPDSFSHFNSDDEKNAFGFEWLDRDMARRRAEYDNSIMYTDNLLGQMIKEVSGLDNPAVLLYFSDHGENVYDNSAYSGRDDSSVEVPFILYANSKYRDGNPTIIHNLNGVLDLPFSTANIVHLLISLTGSSYSYYDPQLDILSDRYVTRPRYVDEQIWKYERIDN